MDVHPKVAVVTRTKDRPVFLQRAMESVLSQSFEDWVHVIVNDGGDPLEVDLLVKANSEAYDGRIKVVHHKESKGMQNASNAGIAASGSTYVVIHDDDDSWYEDFLEKTVEFLEQEGPESLVQAVVCQTTQVFEEVCISGEVLKLRTRPYYPFDFVNLEEMRKRNLFAPIAFLYRRSVHEQVGLFRQEFDVLGDHDFNLRVLRHFEIGVIPTFHAYYHWRHGSMANTVTRARGIHRQMLSRLKNHYYRDTMDNPTEAVGSLEKVEFPERDGMDEIPFKLRTEEPSAPLSLPALEKEYDFDVLSVDVFDTALKRRCHHPKDVFKFLENRAVRDCGLKAQPYALAREKAEAIARRKQPEDKSPEPTLDEIYAELASLCKLNKKDALSLKELELTIEKELLYADPRWLDITEKLRKSGKRVVFVSDMYLDAGTIAGLLSGCGFVDPEVYSSCEYKASKHDGNLQGLVQKELKIDPGKILHVGDNFHSDYIKTVHAGWQAIYWSPDFNYKPMHAQVDPFIHKRWDLLSARVMGEVERLGLTVGSGNTDLVELLGREVAGPLYLCYLKWVLKQARKDGIKHLHLIGRDGHYWEKSLSILSEKEDLGIEFSYLHASRKVFNFASFRTLDETALKFLKTPNPALTVRDYIDRTGLDSGNYLEYIRMAGFDDPDEVLTNEMGGRFLEPRFDWQLDNLFKMIQPDLEKIFEEDRAGVRKVLQEGKFNRKKSAFVDIGWNGSCVRPIASILDLPDDEKINAYFFGTWEEALEGAGAEQVNFKSYYLTFSKPDSHFQLIRESVNLIESLHAAPFPTLLAFKMEGEAANPVYASKLKGGFNAAQQKKLWKGAEKFLRAAMELELPESDESDGHCYITLALNRLLREPSPNEVKKWGKILHSDGFGLEVYKPLIESVSKELKGEELLRAYRGSNWKRGFLSSLPASQRNYILDRIQNKGKRSYEELIADLEWKTKQADELWEDRERLKWETSHFREEAAKLEGERQKLLAELHSKSRDAEKTWTEREQLKWEVNNQKKYISELEDQCSELRGNLHTLKGDLEFSRKELEQLEKKTGKLQGDLDYKLKQADELWAEKEQMSWKIGDLEKLADELQSSAAKLEGDLKHKSHQADELWGDKEQLSWEVNNLKEECAELKQVLIELTSERDHLKQVLRSRSQTLKVFVTGKTPKSEDS
ncbi:MAG: glycosyltransferase [Puniceicoccaceae bacterium]